MTLYRNEAGTWTRYRRLFRKVSGVWTEVQKLFRKASGVWQRVYLTTWGDTDLYGIFVEAGTEADATLDGSIDTQVWQPDGLRVIVGVDQASTPELREYTFSTPFDWGTVATTTVHAVPGTPANLFFDIVNGGTKLYISDPFNTNTIEQYTLSPAWDVSSATSDGISFDLSPARAEVFRLVESGTTLITTTSSAQTLVRRPLSVAYDISTTGASTQSYTFPELGTNVMNDIQFFDGGTKLVITTTVEDVYVYSLSSAYTLDPAPSFVAKFDASAFAYWSTTPNSASVAVVGSGTKLSAITSDIDGAQVALRTFTLNTANVLTNNRAPFVTSAAVNSFIEGSMLSISSDGAYLFNTKPNALPNMQRYPLSVPFDVTTIAASADRSFSIGADTGPDAYGHAFSVDGTHLYVFWNATTGTGEETIRKYTLSTAFDTDTATFSGEFTVGTLTWSGVGLWVNDSGTALYMVGETDTGESSLQSGTLYKLAMSTPHDIATMSLATSAPLRNSIQPNSLAVSADEKTFLVTTRYNTMVGYSTAVAGDISTLVHDGTVSLKQSPYNLDTPVFCCFSRDLVYLFHDEADVMYRSEVW